MMAAVIVIRVAYAKSSYDRTTMTKKQVRKQELAAKVYLGTPVAEVTREFNAINTTVRVTAPSTRGYMGTQEFVFKEKQEAKTTKKVKATKEVNVKSLTVAELKALLEKNKIVYKSSDKKSDLVKKAQKIK